MRHPFRWLLEARTGLSGGAHLFLSFDPPRLDAAFLIAPDERLLVLLDHLVFLGVGQHLDLLFLLIVLDAPQHRQAVALAVEDVVYDTQITHSGPKKRPISCVTITVSQIENTPSWQVPRGVSRIGFSQGLGARLGRKNHLRFDAHSLLFNQHNTFDIVIGYDQRDDAEYTE